MIRYNAKATIRKINGKTVTDLFIVHAASREAAIREARALFALDKTAFGQECLLAIWAVETVIDV